MSVNYSLSFNYCHDPCLGEERELETALIEKKQHMWSWIGGDWCNEVYLSFIHSYIYLKIFHKYYYILSIQSDFSAMWKKRDNFLNKFNI